MVKFGKKKGSWPPPSPSSGIDRNTRLQKCTREMYLMYDMMWYDQYN